MVQEVRIETHLASLKGRRGCVSGGYGLEWLEWLEWFEWFEWGGIVNK